MSHTLNQWELAAVAVLQLRITFFPDRINTICHFISFWMWKWDYDNFLFSSRCRWCCFIFWQCISRHNFMKFKASTPYSPVLTLFSCSSIQKPSKGFITDWLYHFIVKMCYTRKEHPARMTEKCEGTCEVVTIHTGKIWYWLWQYISELQV